MKKIVIWIVILALLRAAWEFPMKDELECGLPDGSKFVLTSTYNYSLIAAHLMPHAQSISERTDFSVQFKPKNSQVLLEVARPYSMEYKAIIIESKELCKNFYLLENKYHIHQYIISTTDNSQSEIPAGNLKGLSISLKENTAETQLELFSKSLTPIYESFFSATKEGYIFEQALTNTEEKCNARLSTDEQCKIVAVARSQLNTSSQTWTEPIITKDAEIFELGKTIYEQSFIARPISINGKKIESNAEVQELE